MATCAVSRIISRCNFGRQSWTSQFFEKPSAVVHANNSRDLVHHRYGDGMVDQGAIVLGITFSWLDGVCMAES